MACTATEVITEAITEVLGLLEGSSLTTTMALRGSLAIVVVEKAAECRRI
jgi:hypothetical protein